MAKRRKKAARAAGTRSRTVTAAEAREAHVDALRRLVVVVAGCTRGCAAPSQRAMLLELQSVLAELGDPDPERVFTEPLPYEGRG